jgi:DNA-binding FadR family transcriptional regulator
VTSPARRYLRVAEEVLHSIGVGNLSPGDRLPDERALAKRCGVSRSTAREALLALELSGVIEVRPGAGCFVAMSTSRPAPVLTLNPDSLPRQTLEVRRSLEPAAARKCAVVATDEDRRQLVAVLDEAARQVDAPTQDGVDRYVACNVDFHRQLARASGNAVLAEITEGLLAPERHPLWSLVDSLTGRDDGNRVAQLAEHKAVLRAVLDRDPDAAEQAMTVHMEAMARRVFGAVADPVRPARPRRRKP